MKIASICTRRVVTVQANEPLDRAAALMREHHVGALVITTPSGEGLQVRGLVTDRDLVMHVLARGLNPAGLRIGELASPQVLSASEDDDVGRAIATMRKAGVRRLLVTDAQQRLSGIVSFDDIVQALAAQFAGLADVLGAGIDREAGEPPPTPPLPPTLQRIPAMGTAGWSL
jgi:CBS domain-containing protein